MKIKYIATILCTLILMSCTTGKNDKQQTPQNQKPTVGVNVPQNVINGNVNEITRGVANNVSAKPTP